jgi:hypothetical protein
MDEKWVYKTITLDFVHPGKVDAKLNELGKQGWEAVGVGLASNMAGMATRQVVLFKKRYIDSEHPGDNTAGLRLKQLLEEERERKGK